MIKIVEVGPRDGLQNEKKKLRAIERVQLIRKLSQAGIKNIEVGAFVSPKKVPQMADTDIVYKLLAKKQWPNRTQFSCLTPNLRGMEMALEAGAKKVAVFGACSETFSQKNINCSINESFKRFKQVIDLANQNNVPVRGYLSTAFGCPYEGKVSLAKVKRLIERMLKMGVYEVSVGDTIGVASPKQVEKLLSSFKGKSVKSKLAMHFHDTRGTALANVATSLNQGIKVFDSSVGGLGGCPYAPGASGNLATDDLVYMLHAMGLKTGVDLDKLLSTAKWVEARLKRKMPSKLHLAGPPNPPVN